MASSKCSSDDKMGNRVEIINQKSEAENEVNDKNAKEKSNFNSTDPSNIKFN